MTPYFLSKSHILELYDKYSNELSTERFQKICVAEDGGHDGAISRVDGILMYLFIRDLKLKNGLEFSYNTGYSSAFIYEAFKKNNEETNDEVTFMTFDIERPDSFNKRAARLGFQNHFRHEDAISGIPNYLYQNRLCGHIDFCNIDSDHEGRFAHKYLSHIWPLLSSECLIFIHDMCWRLPVGGHFNRYSPIHTSEIRGNKFAEGEGEYLRNWLAGKNYIVYSTHKLFGGEFDGSDNIERNNDLCEAIKGVWPQFSYGLRACMSLVILKTDMWAGLEILNGSLVAI